MRYLVLDFETVDPFLNKKIGLGPGWCYPQTGALHFKTIGYGYCTVEDENDKCTISPPTYKIVDCDSRTLIESLLASHDAVIMHNAQYDLGCLRHHQIDIRPLRVFDTKVMAQLYDNNLMSYSLEFLSNKYLPRDQQKAPLSLAEVVSKHSLLKTAKGTPRNTNTKSFERDARSFAYENMDLIQQLEPEVMAFYCNQDIVATANLFVFLKGKLGDLEQSEYYSNFQLICTTIREKGVKIDMAALKAAIAKLTPEVEALRKKTCELLSVPDSFNLLSRDLAPVLSGLGYQLPRTKKTDSESVPKEWLEENAEGDVLIKTLIEWRATNKVLRDYLIKILDNMTYTCPEAMMGADYGYVYPELNLLGARTGRFSSSSPNIQQIPNPEKSEIGRIARSIYVPRCSTNLWVKADWSNQEGRLQVHYANIIRAQGIELLVDEFNKDPNLDMHSVIGKMLGDIPRKQAKGINLGLSYGMGISKLAAQLGVSVGEASRLKDLYHTRMPFLKGLIDMTSQTMKTRGYIKLIDGRIIRREVSADPRINYDYKSLNKLIQGSAASQCLKALKLAYDAGLDIIMLVHDEFDIETNSSSDISKLKNIMETAIPMSVPMVAEISTGKNWADLTKYDVDGTIDNIKLDMHNHLKYGLNL